MRASMVSGSSAIFSSAPSRGRGRARPGSGRRSVRGDALEVSDLHRPGENVAAGPTGGASAGRVGAAVETDRELGRTLKGVEKGAERDVEQRTDHDGGMQA